MPGSTSPVIGLSDTTVSFASCVGNLGLRLRNDMEEKSDKEAGKEGRIKGDADSAPSLACKLCDSLILKYEAEKFDI